MLEMFKLSTPSLVRVGADPLDRPADRRYHHITTTITMIIITIIVITIMTI